ncbi:hypothetical protein [Terriglobus sp.]|uniref:hypothetical protein n=1 Tax=Terriglobus sp. TaxID=1889013 RepID=UPI003AFFF6D2
MPASSWNPYRWPPSYFYGTLLALGYGLLFRLLIALGEKYVGKGAVLIVMSLGFVALVPLVIGTIAVYVPARHETVPIRRAMMLPALPILLACAVAAVLALEGSICIVLLLPVALLFGALGGLLGLALAQAMRPKPGLVAAVAVLPFFCSFVESRVQQPTTMHTVENSIVIHAGAATIWQNIQSVPPIAPSELRPTWAHSIGFPRPVAAILSHPGIGGVRTASFEHGLVFYETVDDWQPLRQLGFSIKADTAHIPPTTLDEHVTIGGPYFDVLDGQYRIEPLSDGSIRLHLVSHQRLTTDFNGYAGLWSDAIMGNLQSSILQVIQHRCEAPQRNLSAAIH